MRQKAGSKEPVFCISEFLKKEVGRCCVLWDLFLPGVSAAPPVNVPAHVCRAEASVQAGDIGPSVKYAPIV